MQLPPPGGDRAAIASTIDQWVLECNQDANRQTFIADAEEALNFYLGEQWETAAPAGQDRIVLNRVQNCVISIVALQAGDPPKITFTPRESGEPAAVYLNVYAADAERLMLKLAEAAALPDVSQPLPASIADQVREIINQSYLPPAPAIPGMAAPVAEPPIGRDVLIEVTDQLSAEALQTVFDGLWEEGNCQTAFVENILNKNIFGAQPTLYEFDDERKLPSLSNVHPMHWFVDPLNSDPRRSHYVIYDPPYSADEAKARWPHLAEQIDATANEGQIRPGGNYQYVQSAGATQQFRRPMARVRVAWVRYQRYPMDLDEALEKGLVRMEQIADGPPVPDGEGMGAMIQPSREAYLDGDGNEVRFGEGSWPTRLGVRRITIVAGEVVEDIENPTGEIPMPLNRNVPIPFSPYGQGEPKRLKPLQQAINKLLSGYVTHHRYNAWPAEFIPESVVKEMGEGLKTARTRPGQRVVVPDHLLEMFGDMSKIIQTSQVGAMPTEFWQLLNLLIALIDKEGNQAEVLQGNAESGWSGETIKALQNAASQIIQGKSMFTEFYLRDIAELLVHSIVTRMSAGDWRRYLEKYPPAVVEAFYSRRKALYKDIQVEIRSGSGAARQTQTQQIVAAKQMGVNVSEPTLMERLGMNPDSEMQREIDWQKRKAEAMRAVNPALAQPAAIADPALAANSIAEAAAAQSRAAEPSGQQLTGSGA